MSTNCLDIDSCRRGKWSFCLEEAVLAPTGGYLFLPDCSIDERHDTNDGTDDALFSTMLSYGIQVIAVGWTGDFLRSGTLYIWTVFSGLRQWLECIHALERVLISAQNVA